MTLEQPDRPVADAVPQNWVDRYAPPALRPYFRLARYDRPIGTWLLLWPCWWSLALAGPTLEKAIPSYWLLVLFAIGAIAMRGAGCTYNDLVDREYDAQVARTRSRPIPSGQVSVQAAWIFLVVQSLVGLIVLLQMNGTAILVGLCSLLPVAIYPWMKRFTYWPQLFLGIAFNWGALMGWTAATGSLGWAPVLMYLAGIFWTLGYDTIYAHQDKDDDALIGLKSTALRLGGATVPWLAGFYSATIVLLALSGAAAGMGSAYYAGLAGAAFHLFRQVRGTDIDNPDQCLAVFRSNRDFGAIVFISLIIGTLTAPPGFLG